MNERIRELAEQAMSDVREEAYPEERSWGMDDVMEKFAELIVKECAEVAVFKDDGNVFSTADVAGARAAGRVIAANLIKEHFGVD